MEDGMRYQIAVYDTQEREFVGYMKFVHAPDVTAWFSAEKYALAYIAKHGKPGFEYKVAQAWIA